MPQSLRIAVEEPSQTAEARRAARQMARKMGFDEARTEQVAIAVTEACTNILNHAGRGQIVLGVTDGQATKDLELLAIDQGPGMNNIALCRTDGYSTSGTPGQGLGAIGRMANLCDVHSVRGRGTLLLARWTTDQPPSARQEEGHLRIGAVSVSKHGELACGDNWGAEQNDEFSSVLLADGLGHGYEASLASSEAVRVLRQNSMLSPLLLMERLHQALRPTRGAAVGIVRIDRNRGKLTFCGVGNIAGQIYSGSQPGPRVVSMNGTLGHQAQRMREFSYPWPEDGILILYSDGLTSGTSLETFPGVAMRDPSLIAGLLYRDFARGHDDATVVVAKGAVPRAA